MGTLSFRESRLDGIERDLSKVVRFNRRNPSPFKARSTYGTPGDSRDAATGDADERAQSGSMAAGCALRAGHGVLTQGVRVTDDLSVVNEWLAEFDVTMFRGEDGKYRIWATSTGSRTSLTAQVSPTSRPAHEATSTSSSPTRWTASGARSSSGRGCDP